MQIASAMMPDPPESKDRLFTTPHAAIMLDGASAFVPVSVSTGLYVDTLGGHLRSSFLNDPKIDLAVALRDAINFAKNELELRPGMSPSATVAIAREYEGTVDLLVLGDTEIVTPSEVLIDNRIGKCAISERRAYRGRLRLGHGYDEKHRALLQVLQAKQANCRNRPDGYWIAEAVPDAANHALRVQHNVGESPWCVIATDGACKTLEHNTGDWWRAALSEPNLDGLLEKAHIWERDQDPDGTSLHRAKRHDDKTIAVIRFLDTPLADSAYAPGTARSVGAS